MAGDLDQLDVFGDAIDDRRAARRVASPLYAAEKVVLGRLIWDLAVDAAGGDNDLLRDVLASILEECPLLADQLERALRDHDPQLARHAAHTIKGALRFFGQTHAGELAARLEKLAKSGRVDGGLDTFESLAEELNSLLADVRARISEH